MATKLIVDRAANGAALSATQYDNNVDSMCGVCEEDTTGTYSLSAADQNKTIQFNHATATAVTVPAIATITGSINTSQWKCTMKNVGAGDATISTTTAIDGSTDDIVLKQYQSITIQTNDANDGWNVIAIDGPVVGVQNWKKGEDVASANALPVLPDGNYFDVTGTTSITSINSLGIGTQIKLHFDGALTLTHHATDLILPGGANITTAAGDEAEFVQYAAGDWRCTNYQVASSVPYVDSTVTAAIAAAQAAATSKVAILQYNATSGTAGPTYGTTWSAVAFNDELFDADNIVTLTATRFTPIAGNYHLQATVAVYENGTGNFQARLYNYTQTAVVADTYSTQVRTASDQSTDQVVVNTYFTADGVDEYELQIYSSTNPSDAVPAKSLASIEEVYADLSLMRIS